MQNKKFDKSAPLPFVGQKRNFVKWFVELVEQRIPDDGEGWTIIDAFGGSGLLSHIAKRLKPKATVIYNDYDGYVQKLQNIPDFNRLRAILAEIVADIPTKERIDDTRKEQILQAILNFDGVIDYQWLSSQLLFTGKNAKDFEQLKSHSFFNRVKKSDYAELDGYLNGLKIVHCDFREILKQQDNKTLLILDPPYLCTQHESYKQETFFNLTDFLALMDLIKSDYLFFSSTKSEILNFMHYCLKNKNGYSAIFENAKIKQKEVIFNHKVKYEDNLIYNFSINQQKEN